MGAVTFFCTPPTVGTVEQAFHDAVEQARYDFGHAGYTGTIAEKDSWVVIDATGINEVDADRLARTLIEDDDERIRDKWGPAGAILLQDGTWLFFGWASC